MLGCALAGLPVPWASALDPWRQLTEYRRQSWGPEDGLPCHNVLCAVQAEDGYLWLGTEEGLVRFDGLRARVFDGQSDPVLVSHSVSSVVRDAHHPGQLLLGGTGGLSRFAGGRIQAMPARPTLAGQPSRILLQDPADGDLWVTTAQGLFRLDPDGATVEGPLEAASGWPAETVRTLCRDGTGRLWVGTARGLYRQHDREDSQGSRLDLLPGWSAKGIDHLAAARGGGIWVCSRDGGSGHLGEDGTFRPRAELSGCDVTSLLEDRAGMLWVGTAGSGVLRLSTDEAPGAGPSSAKLTTANGLVHNLVNGLFEDREGNLWVSTQGGLQVLRDVRFVNFGRPEGLAGDDVRAVFEDARGQIWVGHGDGLSALGPPGNPVINYPLPPSPYRPGDHRVLCVGAGEEPDTLWIGSDAGLIRWREGKLEALTLREDLDRSQVRALCGDGSGGHWVGTNHGLYRVRGNEVLDHLTVRGGLAHDRIHALLADQRGNLWVATAGGLSQREPDGHITNFLVAGTAQAVGSVLSLHEPPDRPGELFVGTELGLHRVRPAGDGRVQIARYTVRQGLFDDLAWAVLGDGQGNLWMSSNRGISRVATADLDRLDRGEVPKVPHVAYGLADGMRSRECNGAHQPAAWRDHLGQLWFATAKGAAVVDPTRVEIDARPPPVVVEEMVVDGCPVPLQAEDTLADRGWAPITLAAGTKRFDLRYTALGLTLPEANRFRYRLEGFDAGWTDAGTERVAHYTNLSPGKYRFRVLAANADGVWNEVGASLDFHLRPFFYQTGWWRGLVLVSGGALLWLSYHWLRRRWQRRLIHAEAELTERTRHQEVLRHAKEAADTARQEAERANAAKSEFLSRMSHELRTPLNAILGFGQLLEMEKLAPRQLQSVGHILGGGRHLLGLVDEILDLSRVGDGAVPLRCEAVELGPVLREVTALLEPLATGGSVKLQVEEAGASVTVLADRQRLKQVLLNLLANAVKYNRPGGGGQVLVGLRDVVSVSPDRAPRARVLVRDTGVGIGPDGLAKLFTPFERLGAAYGPVEGTGLGLAISKALTEAMGGTIGVESTLGLGSTFWVELPVVPSSAEEPILPTLTVPIPD